MILGSLLLIFLILLKFFSKFEFVFEKYFKGFGEKILLFIVVNSLLRLSFFIIHEEIREYYDLFV